MTRRTKPVSRCSAPSRLRKVVFGIGAGDHRRRVDASRPSRACTPAARSSCDQDARDGRAGADFGARAPRPRGERLAQRRPCRPSGCASAGGAARRFGRQAVEQRQHRARRARPEIGAEHGVEAERALAAARIRNAPRAGRRRSCRRCAAARAYRRGPACGLARPSRSRPAGRSSGRCRAAAARMPRTGASARRTGACAP